MDINQVWQFGVPTGILMFLGYAGWQAGKWLGTNAILPWVNAHINLANVATESIKSQAQTLVAIQEHTVALPSAIAPVVAQVCRYPGCAKVDCTDRVPLPTGVKV